jgi:hypothetical protein
LRTCRLSDNGLLHKYTGYDFRNQYYKRYIEILKEP